ncbi:flocculation suppression protein [Histoplasma capsulatum G186AR]|uniref:Flocculation suppression protein n=1 Tax=Ajellomyces capsulatus TaxID=5037 RepID=A0A8H7YR52_AJECA|nr:flocculation suppression protein [Histoplasma capsulatum]QSS73742.1 flocculation suppression protein [Histoplasma capsulatum G186AR]
MFEARFPAQPTSENPEPSRSSPRPLLHPITTRKVIPWTSRRLHRLQWLPPPTTMASLSRNTDRLPQTIIAITTTTTAMPTTAIVASIITMRTALALVMHPQVR